MIAALLTNSVINWGIIVGGVGSMSTIQIFKLKKEKKIWSHFTDIADKIIKMYPEVANSQSTLQEVLTNSMLLRDELYTNLTTLKEALPEYSNILDETLSSQATEYLKKLDIDLTIHADYSLKKPEKHLLTLQKKENKNNEEI